jgi:hypothetical protein
MIGIIGITGSLFARENVGSSRGNKSHLKTTASGCAPSQSAIDLDINNVRARLMTGGDMWWNQGSEVAAYEVPKGSGRHSQFAASCWIGGFDKQGQLKVAAQTYRQDGNDYWPGALNDQGKVSEDTCKIWDKFWKVDRSTIKRFVQDYKTGAPTVGVADYEVIKGWPAKGNRSVDAANGVTLSLGGNKTYAPFVDYDGDGEYNSENGDYPDIRGDQYVWWVFNDAGNVKQQSLTAAMGIEVQTSAFAFSTQDFLNNATFYNYRVINRGALTIDSTYIAVWDDADLGYYLDDFIGCDTTRGLGILYNGTNNDGQAGGSPSNSYGTNPPQVGLDFFQGPKRIKQTPSGPVVEQLRMTNFTYYNNDASIIGNPTNGVQIYYYMTGSIRNGQRFANDFLGAGVPSKGYGAGAVSNFVFWGDPSDNTQWSECACGNNPGDRRFVFSSGPFQLLPGAVNDIIFGSIWAPGAGGCPSTNFKSIKNIDDGAQALFDNNFKTIEGPEAPRLVVRELDRKLVFYLLNDYGSNNYGENYGRTDGAYNDSLQYHQKAAKAIASNNPNDSLYKFQGYRVFQLANSQITSAEIFDPVTGEVDKSKAVEVFQCDIRDSVTMIVNYTKVVGISDTTFMPQIKVVGKDSGISHSFVLTQDQFATGSDKRFINYHNYYFVALAYAHNNFASFNPRTPLNTQDVPYLGSAHGGGGTDIKVIAALPNPANGDMGTVLGSDYGAGVKITRVQGQGNGGNILQLTEQSESEIMANNAIGNAEYVAGAGPVNVKVVDPVKVPSADIATDWVLQIKGANTPLGTATTGFVPRIVNSGSWVLTGFKNGVATDVIYSERSLGDINEQIIEKYGLSVTINQVLPPGEEPTLGNGYITSDITFDEQSKSWLWGVEDQPDSNFRNWLRSGSNTSFDPPSATNPCLFNDNGLDPIGAYQNLLSNFSPAKSTWGPYSLAAFFYSGGAWFNNPATDPIYSACGFTVAALRHAGGSDAKSYFRHLSDVNIVFTSDKSKWTRCAVIEQQEDTFLSEGRIPKFYLRKHKGWNADVSGDNTPVYSDNPSDAGMSYFPGYAINENTGERLNIVFGEDSYLSSDNGNDMIWNPTSHVMNQFDNSIIFGGKHTVYILGSRYDSCKTFVSQVNLAKGLGANPMSVNALIKLRDAYQPMQWVGLPVTNPSVPLASLKDGIVPTKTTIRFRVTRPYGPYQANNPAAVVPKPLITFNPGEEANPYYTFTTKDLAVVKVSDATDRDTLLSRIHAVPNPYYGYSGYEKANSRFDTKVRIINLPARATVHIYSLDGTLVRRLEKSDPNTPYIDWDIRNTVGLPVASGMYLMNVKAEGIGETVIRWFGAQRPLDVSTY